jgi:hypothetical protein
MDCNSWQPAKEARPLSHSAIPAHFRSYNEQFMVEEYFR